MNYSVKDPETGNGRVFALWAILWNGLSEITDVPLIYFFFVFISESASLRHISEHHKASFGRQLNLKNGKI